MNFDEAYFRNLLYYAIPGLVLALATIIASLIFFCCWRAGQVLRPRDAPASKPRFICVFVVLTVAICIAFALGFVGNVEFHNSVHTLTNDTVDYLDMLENTNSVLVQSISQLQTLGVSSSVVAAFNKTQSDLTQAVAKSKTLKSDTDTAEDYRFSLSIVALALAGLVILLGLFAALAQVKTLAFCMMVLACLTAIIAWLFFAFHLPAHILTRDACTQSDDTLHHGKPLPPQLNSPEYAEVASCFQNGTYGPAFTDMYNDLANQTEQLADLAILAGMTNIDDTIPDLPPDANDEEMIFNLGNYTDELIANISGQIGNVLDPTTQEALEEAVNSTQAYVDVATTLAAAVSCTQVRAHVTSLTDNFCDDGSMLLYVVAAHAIIGAFIAFIGYHLLTAFRRVENDERLMWDGRRSSVVAPLALAR